MAKFDFKPWWSRVQARFFGAADLDNLLRELDALLDETERLLQQHGEGDRSLIACHAGCQDCCVVNVSVSLLEGIAIARLVRQWDEPQRNNVATKLDALWRVVRGLDDDERLMVRKSCAFLDSAGCCAIYRVRPLFCRGVTSTDVAACRAAIADQAFGITTEVMMHEFQLGLYRVAFDAISSGLHDSGRDGRSFQLSGLVRYLLSHPDCDDQLLETACLGWDDLY